jgi:hypothetical protein
MGLDLSKINNPALRAQIERALKTERVQDKRIMYTPKDGKASTAKHEKPLPESEPPIWQTLVGTARRAQTGQEGVDCRIVVRIVCFRCHLCDPDNNASGVKALLDSIRYATLIPNDRPEDIKLETDQVRVKHRSEEKTVIEIEYPE